eukprot:jgi/Psemu1/231819/e_gw1.4271.1.1
MIQQRIQRINKNNNNNDNNNKNTLDNYNTTTEKASSATTTTSTANANPPQHFRDKIAHSIAKGERRARERSHRTLRTVCPGCARPFNLCLCDVFVPPSELLTGTNIVVLQHPNEFRKKHTSTVPLLKLVLGTEHVRVKVGYEFTREDVLFGSSSNASNQDQAESNGSPSSVVVGNTEPSTTTPSVTTTNTTDAKTERTTLVLIDGTWSEAKRIIRKSPEVLEACQMVHKTGGTSRSIYNAMRREPDDHCLSTLEACGAALSLLE